jgi:hypothetical protein
MINVPVWVFHGEQDPAVPLRASRKMILRWLLSQKRAP